MGLIIFASTLIVAIIIAIETKKSSNISKQKMDEFFEREHKANFTRKKSLDNLEYVSIPDEFLTYDYRKAFEIENFGGRAEDALDTIKSLSNEKIVNFTGKSNTDLKLEYGTANITILSEYDQNYSSLVRSIQTLAESVINTDRSFAKKLLCFSVETGSDISKSYKLLFDIYKEEFEEDKDEEKFNREIEDLKANANMLNGIMKSSIMKYLEPEDCQ